MQIYEISRFFLQNKIRKNIAHIALNGLTFKSISYFAKYMNLQIIYRETFLNTSARVVIDLYYRKQQNNILLKKRKESKV